VMREARGGGISRDKRTGSQSSTTAFDCRIPPRPRPPGAYFAPLSSRLCSRYICIDVSIQGMTSFFFLHVFTRWLESRRGFFSLEARLGGLGKQFYIRDPST